MIRKGNIGFGLLSAPLSKQLLGFRIPRQEIEHAQKDADAIERLRIRGLLTDGQVDCAQRKLVFAILEKSPCYKPIAKKGQTS